MEILLLRTNDNFDQLIRQGYTHSWIVSEDRLLNCMFIKIYNFDGTRCIEGHIQHEYNIIDPRDNRRYIIAINNTLIVNTNYHWIGQNPVAYEQV